MNLLRLTLVLALVLASHASAQSPRSKAVRPGAPAPPAVGRGAAAPNRPMRVGPGTTKSGLRNAADTDVATETAADAADAKNLGEYVRFPTVSVKLRQPKDFEKDKTFDGFGQRETTSSVMIVVLKGPFREVTAGFTADKLRARGWKFLSKSDVKLGEQTGVLVNFEQPAAGTTFVKWTAAFGTDEQTTLVTATFPKDEEANLSATLKSCVLSAVPDDGPPADPDAEIPFTIAATKKLKRTQGVSRIIAFTEGGKIPAASPKEALLIAAPSLGVPALASTKATAERRFRETARIKNLKIASTKEVQVGDLIAFESQATADDEKTGTPLALYQLMIFTTDGYILVQGLVGAETQDEFLPEFERLAHSIQLKPAPTDK